MDNNQEKTNEQELAEVIGVDGTHFKQRPNQSYNDFIDEVREYYSNK